MKSSPIEMYFRRAVQGVVTNQFSCKCAVKEAIQQLVQKEFNIATLKGSFIRDHFKNGDPVQVKNITGVGICDIKGVIVWCQTATDRTSKVIYSMGRTTYQRNGSHILHRAVTQ